MTIANQVALVNPMMDLERLRPIRIIQNNHEFREIIVLITSYPFFFFAFLKYKALERAKGFVNKMHLDRIFHFFNN